MTEAERKKGENESPQCLGKHAKGASTKEIEFMKRQTTVKD